MPSARVLVVEDEFLIRLILVEELADAGFDVVEASDGDAAVLLLDSYRLFDAVVTDIHMPGSQDGIAVGRHARLRSPAIPIVYCTGRPDAMSAAGALGHNSMLIRKPYLPSQVVVALQGLLALPNDSRNY